MGLLKRPYRETGMRGASLDPCGGFSVSHPWLLALTLAHGNTRQTEEEVLQEVVVLGHRSRRAYHYYFFE